MAILRTPKHPCVIQVRSPLPLEGPWGFLGYTTFGPRQPMEKCRFFFRPQNMDVNSKNEGCEFPWYIHKYNKIIYFLMDPYLSEPKIPISLEQSMWKNAGEK